VALVLDTNALSALAEGDPALDRVIAGQRRLAITVISLGEYIFGIRQSRDRASYEQWIQESLGLFDVLKVDFETSNEYAAIRSELQIAGTPIPMNDIWIAAITRRHKRVLVTRDRHFEFVHGIRVKSW
jgi:predicted nucleic acid-binding protein